MLKRPSWPSLDLMNRLYMGPTTTWVAVIGSASSVLLIGAFLWAILRILRRDFPITDVWQARAIALVLALFFLVEALSGVVSFNGATTMKAIVENVTFLAFLPVYSRLALSERQDIRNAIETAAAIGAFAAFAWAAFQTFEYHMRAEGGAGNATPFAMANLVAFTITLLACLRSRGQRRVVFGLATLAIACSVILSGTRSLWPALIIVPLIAGVIYRQHIGYRHFGRLLAASLLLLAASGFLASDLISARLEAVTTDVNAALAADYSGSIGQRLVVWKSGLELFIEAPIFGHGPGNAEALLLEKSAEMTGTALAFSHYHNVFLNYAVRDGILGVLVILAILIVPLVLAARNQRDEIGAYGLAFMAAMIATFLLSGTVGIMFGHDIFDTLFVISMITAAFLVFGRGRQQESARAGAAP